MGLNVKKEIAESDSSDSEDSDYLDNFRPIKQEQSVPPAKVSIIVIDCLISEEWEEQQEKEKESDKNPANKLPNNWKQLKWRISIGVEYSNEHKWRWLQFQGWFPYITERSQ